jgi:hypothetical protein
MTLDASPRSTDANKDASAKLSSESVDLLKANQIKMQTLTPVVETGTANGSAKPLSAEQGAHPDKPHQNSIKAADGTDPWIIPDLAKGEPPRFGLKGGLQFGFYPGSLDPNNKNDDGGPRGLIRVWSPALPGKNYCLANFIAVEPTAKDNPEWGSSELENSQSDWKPGKVMTVDPNSVELKTIALGVQELSLTADVEKFHNGSHVKLDISERSDEPEQLHFKVHTAEDSAPLKDCVLTATWGNLTRSREIWLKDGIQNSLAIPSYRVYRGYDFAPDQFYGIDKLTQLPNGNMAAALTTNETHPDSIHPLFGSDAWYWGAKPITQYWEVPNADKDLNLRVNGRFMYWNSKWAIPNGLEVPGGITYENFEMREPFREGQEFIFGASTKKPEELGFGPATDASAKQASLKR